MQRMQNHCIKSMHKMHRVYKNVKKKRCGVVAEESDACVKKQEECNS
jgi:hypothetical protein